MFDEVSVDSRIGVRHPELSEDDVRSAWENAIVYAERATNGLSAPLLVAIGSDSKGRMLELVAVIGEKAIHIFHAMTPPSKKTLKELGVK
ncbi:MAG: hypothetical protein IJ131_10040 [Eggerthellaceae bacterium]|nr:hypothetical protein [Eggerthellaceae bacterium]